MYNYYIMNVGAKIQQLLYIVCAQWLIVAITFKTLRKNARDNERRAQWMRRIQRVRLKRGIAGGRRGH